MPQPRRDLALEVRHLLEEGILAQKKAEIPPTLLSRSHQLLHAGILNAEQVVLEGLQPYLERVWGTGVRANVLGVSAPPFTQLQVVRGVEQEVLRVHRSTWGFASATLPHGLLDAEILHSSASGGGYTPPENGLFSPSKFGIYPCLAQQAYQYRGEARRETAVKLPLAKAFAAGKATHQRMEAILASLGNLVLVEQSTGAGNAHLTGTVDALLELRPDLWVVLEFKSMASGLFRMRRRPDPKWVTQLETYLGITGAQEGVIVAIDKETWALRCWSVQRGEGWFRTKQRAQNLAELLDRGETPPKTPGPYCNHCPYLWTCQPKSLI